MEIAGTFFQEVIALVGYALVFAAVYKLFQISSDLGEIKELLKRENSSLPIALPSTSLSPSSYAMPNTASLQPPPAQTSYDFPDGESATAYAEQLMRAIQGQSEGSKDPR